MIPKGRKLIFVILLLPMQIGLVAQTPQILFDKANSLYQQQEFDKAIEFYQEILSQGYESAEIHYNLGNCYYRLNNLGRAILSYEKALLLEPNDSDIQYNLDLANLRVIDRVSLPPRFFLFEWWDYLLGRRFRHYQL